MKCQCLLFRLRLITIATLWLHTDRCYAMNGQRSLGQLLGIGTVSAQSDIKHKPNMPSLENLLDVLKSKEDASVITSSFFRRYIDARNKRPRLRIGIRNGSTIPGSEEDQEGVGLLGLDNHDFIVSTLDRHRVRPLSSHSRMPPARQEDPSQPFFSKFPPSKSIPNMMRSSVSVTDLRTLMQGMQDLHNAGR